MNYSSNFNMINCAALLQIGTGTEILTRLTCQAMQLPVVFSIIGLKAPELADSDKATGHPKAAANFSADTGDKRQEGRCQLKVTIKSSWCELLHLRSHRYKQLIQMNGFLFRNDKLTLTFLCFHI